MPDTRSVSALPRQHSCHCLPPSGLLNCSLSLCRIRYDSRLGWYTILHRSTSLSLRPGLAWCQLFPGRHYWRKMSSHPVHVQHLRYHRDFSQYSQMTYKYGIRQGSSARPMFQAQHRHPSDTQSAESPHYCQL